MNGFGQFRPNPFPQVPYQPWNIDGIDPEFYYTLKDSSAPYDSTDSYNLYRSRSLEVVKENYLYYINWIDIGGELDGFVLVKLDLDTGEELFKKTFALYKGTIDLQEAPRYLGFDDEDNLQIITMRRTIPKYGFIFPFFNVIDNCTLVDRRLSPLTGEVISEVFQPEEDTARYTVLYDRSHTPIRYIEEDTLLEISSELVGFVFSIIGDDLKVISQDTKQITGLFRMISSDDRPSFGRGFTDLYQWTEESKEGKLYTFDRFANIVDSTSVEPFFGNTVLSAVIDNGFLIISTIEQSQIGVQEAGYIHYYDLEGTLKHIFTYEREESLDYYFDRFPSTGSIQPFVHFGYDFFGEDPTVSIYTYTSAEVLPGELVGRLRTNDSLRYYLLRPIYEDEDAYVFKVEERMWIQQANGLKLSDSEAQAVSFMRFNKDELKNLVSTGELVFEKNQPFSIFPNPAQQRITISDAHRYQSYRISDISGKICASGDLESDLIDVSGIHKGIYCITLMTADGISSSAKWIKE